MKGDKLNDLQRATARNYVVKWNLTQSMIDAGYSPVYADKQGYKLLGNVGFQAYIKELQDDAAKTAGISMVGLLERLRDIAYGQTTDLLDEWEKLKDFKTLSKRQKSTVRKISIKKTKIGDTDMDVENITLEVHNPIEAIKEINKMLGFLSPEKKEVKVDGEILGFLPDGFED